MPSNRLHNWDFALWQGPTPAGVVEHISTHTRAGARGSVHTKLGQWGDPFQVTLTAYYASFLLASDARYKFVEPLPAAGLVRLWWNSIDYLVRYQTQFKVEAVQGVKAQALVSYVSGNVIWYDAGRLDAELILVPHAAS